MIIQIYAFTRIEQAQEAAALGVNHIGFIAGDYGLVYAELSYAQAHQMAASLPIQAHSVALTMSTQVDEILSMAEVVNPSIIHISTDPLELGLNETEQLRIRLPDHIKLMKAIPVVDETSLDLAIKFAPFCDYLLLDTKVGGMPGVGATGRIHDWRISRKIVESVSIPVILAGGLTPENVPQAIQAVCPAGVDSNTSTNIPGDPVEKDMVRIRSFVKAVHSMETSTEIPE
jgi:phosphoribosylanthranilate isomerase